MQCPHPRGSWFLVFALLIVRSQISAATGGEPGQDAAAGGALPTGDHGIAAHYPRDRGIEKDAAVVFADDFEADADADGLGEKWEDRYHNVSIATEPANVFAGKKSLELMSPKQKAELSNGVAHTLRHEVDVLFLRYYAKFDKSFDVVGSSHNGAGISAHYMQNGNATPGVPSDGRNKFLIEFECWRGEAADPNPGNLNVYIYHPEQRSQWGDHLFPDGKVLPNTSLPGNFGSRFVSRPNVVPELGRWYCYEVMVRANTPGQRDGRIALWLDGNLVGDFGNLRLRDIPSLTIDRISLSLHIHSDNPRETRKWYDNVVAATSYIGPMARPR